MASLNEVKQKIRKSTKWGFLAEMLGETDMDGSVHGVTYQGVLLVNPAHAVRESTAVLVEQVRNEFKVAAELRKNVKGFV